MKTMTEQVLEKFLKGRELVVWGNPTRPFLRALRDYPFRVVDKADGLDPKQHYLVAVEEDDFDDFFKEESAKAFKDAEDCIPFGDPGRELPFEWTCGKAKIGRKSYFGEGVAGPCEEGMVKSIGHFTSINSTAKISVSHHLDMIFTSDELAGFLNKENKAIYENRIKNDPRHPYGFGKEPLSIGSDVYIGAHVFINASRVSTIGHGAIIGSSAVVIEDVPPYAVVVGVPAKIKSYRYPPEMIELLLQVQWWEWSEEEINKNFELLMNPEKFKTHFKR